MATVPSATFTHTAEEIDAAVDAVAGKASQEDLDALAEAVEGKQDALTFDNTPTANSDNPVKSKGIKSYVDTGLSGKQGTLTFDSTPTANSDNPVKSKGIKTYVDTQVATKASISDVFGTGNNTYIPDAANLNNYTQAGVYVRQFSTGLADFTNLPMDGTTYPYQPFKLVVEYINSPNNIVQTLIPTYNSCGFFKRCRIFGASGTWQPWQWFGGTPVS